MADVIVNIKQSVRQPGPEAFQIPLLVDLTKDQIYKEYDISKGIDAVKTDYTTDTEVYKRVDTMLNQKSSPATIAICGTNKTAESWTSAKITELLDTTIANNNNFFRVFTTASEDAEKKVIADWCKDNNKFFYGQVGTSSATDYTEYPARINLYTQTGKYLDACEVGYASARLAGSFNLKFKQYEGITSDTLTTSQIADAETKHYGYYTKEEGVAYQQNSYATNGGYIDELEARELIKIMMRKNILSLLINQDKVPANKDGLGMIVAQVDKTLQYCKDNNIVDSYSIDFSKAKFDKSKRKWQEINFNYVYLSGTDEVEINGIVE